MRLVKDKGTFKILLFDSKSTGWHALRYFLFSLPKFNFQPSRVEGLILVSEGSEGSSDSNKAEFNPLGLTGAEISALEV